MAQLADTKAVPSHDDSPDPADERLLAALRDLEGPLRAILAGADDVTVPADPQALLDGLDDGLAAVGPLVEELLTSADADLDRANLDDTVSRCIAAIVHTARFPVAIRQQPGERLPQVACPPRELMHAVWRTLELACRSAGPGGAVEVRAQRDGERAVLTVCSHGQGEDILARALTLRAFAVGLGGRCSVADLGRDALRLTLALPFAMERR